MDLFREIDVISSSLSDHELISAVLSNDLQAKSSRKTTNLRNTTPSSRSLNFQNGTPSFSSLNFQKADFDKISIDLEKLNWERLKDDNPDSDFPTLFYNTVLTICYKYTPIIQHSYKKRRSKYYKICFAINRKRRKIKGRLKALEASHPSSSRSISSLKEKLIALEKEAQQKIVHFKHLEEQKALKAIQENPKYFYSYAKQRKVPKTKVGPLRNPEFTGDNCYFDDPKSMADILQKQFISVFSNPENSEVAEPILQSYCTDGLSDIIFTVNDLIKAIDEIKAHSSSGNVGFLPFFLRGAKIILPIPFLYSGENHWTKALFTPCFCTNSSHLYTKARAVNVRL